MLKVMLALFGLWNPFQIFPFCVGPKRNNLHVHTFALESYDSFYPLKDSYTDYINVIVTTSDQGSALQSLASMACVLKSCLSIYHQLSLSFLFQKIQY